MHLQPSMNLGGLGCNGVGGDRLRIGCCIRTAKLECRSDLARVPVAIRSRVPILECQANLTTATWSIMRKNPSHPYGDSDLSTCKIRVRIQNRKAVHHSALIRTLPAKPTCNHIKFLRRSTNRHPSPFAFLRRLNEPSARRRRAKLDRRNATEIDRLRHVRDRIVGSK